MIMKKYYGTKVLTAVSMTLGTYNHTRGWDLPPNEDPETEGYLVCYPDQKPNVEGFDGYVSWSPKDVFERTYKELPDRAWPYQERVDVERAQLNERAEGLESFIGTSVFFTLSQIEQKSLTEQLEAMVWYRDILDQRISRF